MERSLIASLVDDLEAESAELLAVLDQLPEDAWRTPTPAAGWTVHDQVAHLAHFDWVTRTAVAEPQTFVALRDGLEDLQVYVDSIGPANASRDGADTALWWRRQGDALRGALLAADPAQRVPWFGPPMSLASKVTARIMETWAHGQDVTDALGLVRTPTDRLRHIARIGVLALPHSFRLNDLQVPVDPVFVQLMAPSGATWEWGPDSAADSVTGDALDFCLLVTQRRHVADTSLEVTGPVARAWTQIAQAFAGAPGRGREPGQFTTETRSSAEDTAAAATKEVS